MYGSQILALGCLPKARSVSAFNMTLNQQIHKSVVRVSIPSQDFWWNIIFWTLATEMFFLQKSYILMLRGLIILPCKHLACWPLFCSKVHIDVEGIDPIAL
ncbi:hypothetical protein GOP47_0026981 [Adiantum capillus-veneris]|nr:hypothetical protein GOP47_0026981 [Adiantum capillus-veneris]